MAAGAHTTYFLAKPNDKLSELPIHPELSDLSELCIVCEQDKGENDSPLECEKVRIRLTRALVSLSRLLALVPMAGADPGGALVRTPIPPRLPLPSAHERSRG